MVFKKKLLAALMSGALAAGFAGATQAAVVYNSTITGFTPGVFGNTVGGENFALGTFTDADGDIIELGLRARYRIRPTQASDASGLYGSFDAGTQTAFGALGARSDRAEWSYDFYIRTTDTGPAGGGTLADYTFTLCADLNNGTAFAPDCTNALSFDNLPVASSTESGNSLQLFFSGTPGNSTYDVNSAGLYTFTLSASEGATVIGTTVITAQVPEPGTLAILGLGLAGLGFVRRRKQI